MGKLGVRVGSLRRAYKLDPLSFRPGSEVSLAFQLAGSEGDALEFLERSRDLIRKIRVFARWAEYYLLKRDYGKAQEMLNAGLHTSANDIDLLTDQGVLYAMTERRREAGEVLRLVESSPIEESRLQGQLFVRAAPGELDEAFKALLRLAEIHAWPPLMKSLPVFEKMRSDPRFSEFCASVGLPSYRI